MLGITTGSQGIRHDGATPAFMAAQEGHPEALRLLIAARADVDKAGDTGAVVSVSSANASTSTTSTTGTRELVLPTGAP